MLWGIQSTIHSKYEARFLAVSARLLALFCAASFTTYFELYSQQVFYGRHVLKDL
jgi:predicted SAM-dependent methyltransferase